MFEQIREKVKRKLKKSRDSHNWDHTERVYNNCIKIGREENADMEIVEYAAILHDIGRKKGDQSKGKKCHAKIGAKIAEKMLKKQGLDRAKIEKIIHCIITHRFRSDNPPKSLEAKILFDADKLDAIGAIGIGRAFQFAGEVGARLHNNDIEVEQTDAYSLEDTAYREFLVKLMHVKDRLLTGAGKRLAEAYKREPIRGIQEWAEKEVILCSA